MSRLPAGGLIDRARPLTFEFDGRRYAGFDGDTLASALLANGQKVLARSFKYHRPRGVLTSGPEEPNALVTVGTGAAATPNLRATTVRLSDGLVARGQNAWPNVRFDLGGINNLLSPLFVAGFYYKTFMWPAAFWEAIYEPLIRRAAGLGKLSGAPDPDAADRAHAFCDVLVIGAGPAGLAAALAAGRSGARVLLAEQDWLLGGRLLAEPHLIDGAPALDWVRRAEAELAACQDVTVLKGTAVFGAYDSQVFGAVELREGRQPRHRYWKIRARHVVLATGALERPLVFSGNDHPGVMLASAAQAYVHRFGVAPGRRTAVFTTTDSGWAVAETLAAAGAEVTAVIDARTHVDARVTAQARKRGLRIIQGGQVVDAVGAPLRFVTVREENGSQSRLDADCLAMAGGWNPTVGLGSHTGARPAWDEAAASYVLAEPPRGMAVVGAAAGAFSLAAALRQGAQAGVTAAAECGFAVGPAAAPQADDEPAAISPLWRVKGGRAKAFVDFQHDVSDSDIALAAREGFISVEHLKRYTTLGMATDQGKSSSVNGNALLAAAIGKSMTEVGTVRSRPPHHPISLGALAGHHRGEHFRPVRLTATHQLSVEHGAVFVDVGAWKRAQWFSRPGDKDWLQSASREATAVRQAVGLCDVSTLGKIEVHGPDAAAFLDRVYANTISTLPAGKTRYGLMLREDGFAFDDGTVARFAEDRFYLSTTTANAGAVMQHLDYCAQVIWPELDVQTVSVTEHWSQFAVAGPRSRALLQRLLPEADLTSEAFPFMAAAELSWRGVPMRLFRISFSGELAYEVAVPAAYGEALARELLVLGEDLGLTPYGTEALSILRIEKGHAAGNEFNGQTTAGDLGLGRLPAKRKDYIGKVMAGRPGLLDPHRPRLVGVRVLDPGARIYGGAHLLDIGAAAGPKEDLGHVTSAAYSPHVGGWIALALLRDAEERLGQRIRVFDPIRDSDVEVEVCSPVFVDPEGVRLRD